ncbi:hypothetical protein GCM10027436_47110 [Actinophytocola sediminis]
MLSVRVLRVAAGVETATLVVLLANLLTTHTEAVTTVGGPLHGTTYLAVIALTALAPAGTRWRAAVPGVGGLLALRRLRDQDLRKRETGEESSVQADTTT